MDRVIGTMKDPKTGRLRSGVTVEGIRDALENPANFLRERILIQEKARNILADMEQSH